MQVQLFGAVVPNTATNFKTLCLNSAVNTYHNSSKAKNYNEAVFYKIVSGFYAIGGDIVNNDGTGGEANGGMLLADENFILKHDTKYLLSMVRTGRHRANSNFIITFGIISFLDGQQTVFGKIHADSQTVADQIEALSGSTYEGTPTAIAKITA
mmetsp:Transcript_7228/g.8178  ORF Transcript_7228/g.8178 Transcript_7228/m.8178 type:complete len:154 (-) Transcript_7228:50-511(-)